MILTLDTFIKWFLKASYHLSEKKEYLSDLDSPIGDADHGTNIARGFEIIVKQIEEKKPETIAELLKNAAMVMMTKVGGASGMLYGAFFLKASMAAAKHKIDLNVDAFIDVIEAGVNGIINRGRAEIGDKTMIDVWAPFLTSLKLNKENDFKQTLSQLVIEAEINMKKTTELQAKKGRASYLGERSIGHQDPGATSTYLILLSLKEILE